MEQKCYSIAEAADILGYKPHVIRYYEKEFNLKIPRNKANHRYFTENEILILRQIKELQEKGYNNTQIKMIMKSPEAGQHIYSQLEGVAATAQDIYSFYGDETFRALIETVLENNKKEIIEEFKNQLEAITHAMTMAISELTQIVNELSRNIEDIGHNQIYKTARIKSKHNKIDNKLTHFQQK